MSIQPQTVVETIGVTIAPAGLLQAALHYASLDIEVLPLMPGEKRPHSQLAPHGVKNATTDEVTIREWWQKCPTANIGLRSGNQLFVLDVDVKNGKDGKADLAEMEAELGKLPETPHATTANDGCHLFWQKPDGDIVGRAGILWKGRKTSIDIRTGEQYVVAPPSVVGGKAYRFPNPESHLRRNADGSLNVATLPAAWVAVLPMRDAPSKSVAPKTPVLPSACNSSPDVVERCRNCVDQMPPCVAWQGGDTQLYNVCCVIFHTFVVKCKGSWDGVSGVVVIVRPTNACIFAYFCWATFGTILATGNFFRQFELGGFDEPVSRVFGSA